VRLRTNENRGPQPVDEFIAHVSELIGSKSKEL